MIASSNFHFTWKWGIGHDPPPPRVNVENLSADRSINLIISTGSNIDPRGGGDIRASENGHIFSLLVLRQGRKCVELFYWNWPGLTLSSPIRFSSADRRTKSINWNVEWRVKKCKKMTNMECYPTLSTHQMVYILVLFALSEERKSGRFLHSDGRSSTAERATDR